MRGMRSNSSLRFCGDGLLLQRRRCVGSPCITEKLFQGVWERPGTERREAAGAAVVGGREAVAPTMEVIAGHPGAESRPGAAEGRWL